MSVSPQVGPSLLRQRVAHIRNSMRCPESSRACLLLGLATLSSSLSGCGYFINPNAVLPSWARHSFAKRVGDHFADVRRTLAGTEVSVHCDGSRRRHNRVAGERRRRRKTRDRPGGYCRQLHRTRGYHARREHLGDRRAGFFPAAELCDRGSRDHSLARRSPAPTRREVRS